MDVCPTPLPRARGDAGDGAGRPRPTGSTAAAALPVLAVGRTRWSQHSRRVIRTTDREATQ